MDEADDGNDARGGGPAPEVLLHDEHLVVSTEVVETGRVTATKRQERAAYEQGVLRGVEHAEVDREAAAQGDSGEVITLEDGSLSIPVFEEQIVVTKRLVVRERIVVRKHTVFEDHVISAELGRERLEVTTSDGAVPGPG